MDYGVPVKFDYARKISAALCYVGLLNQDRVNLVGFADGIAQELSARRGKHQVWHAFRFLESVEARGTTSMEKAFKGFFSSRRRRGLVVVVSDFLDEEGFAKAFDMLRFFRQDLFAVHVHTPEEAQPDLPDEVLLEDAELGTSQRVRITPALLEAYANQFDEHCEEVGAYCRKHGWGYLRTTTDVPFEDLILQVFRQGRFLR